MMGRVGRFLDRGLDRLRDTLDARARHPHEEAPFGRTPLAPPSEYRRRWAEARDRPYPVVDRYEAACGAAVDPEWFHQLALLTQVPIKDSEICYQHGRLLYATLAQYARGHSREQLTVVDTGTARGFSALCMAKALDDAGAAGKILSFDVLPHDVAILWNCVADADGPRTRAELLRDYSVLIERYIIFLRGDTRRVMAGISFPRVHFAFLDSVHTFDHVMAEFSAIRDRQLAGDVLFFDDYTADVYPGVVKAADEICRRHGYDPTVVAANARRRYMIAVKD